MDDLHLDTYISSFWYYFIMAHSNGVSSNQFIRKKCSLYSLCSMNLLQIRCEYWTFKSE